MASKEAAFVPAKGVKYRATVVDSDALKNALFAVDPEGNVCKFEVRVPDSEEVHQIELFVEDVERQPVGGGVQFFIIGVLRVGTSHYDVILGNFTFENGGTLQEEE